MTENKKNAAWADCCEDWGGYMVAKKAKLEEQFDERARAEFTDPSTLFSGIAIFVNGYTNPTADELKRLMMAHGGIYHHYLRPHGTTHLIASNLPYTKIVAYRKAQKPLPLCKPEWITDSIKAGKVLDYRNYLLYSQCTKNQPAIFNHFNKQVKSKCETITREKNGTSEIESVSTPSQINPNVSPPVINYSANKNTNVTAQTSNNLSSVTSKVEPTTSREKDKNMNAQLSSISNVTGFNSKHSNTINEEKIASLPIATSSVTPKTSLPTSTVTSMNSKNPQFLTEFFSNSRLHHIATMGAIFKDYINDLRDKSDGKFSGLEALKKKSSIKYCKPIQSRNINDSDSDDDLLTDLNNELNPIPRSVSPILTKKKPIIMHIDMDCFFVSVGLRNHPQLRGFPVAVAHSKGNKQGSSESDEYGSMSEVASCSYEARQAGVKNGMFLGQALKLCPNLKTINYDFEGYKEVSFTLYDTVASYTLDIEAVSCDEMYVDCTKILESSGLSPLDFAAIIRNEIKQKTGCPVSTGFGENKLLARLATKKAKPDGQFHLVGNKAINFIRTLNVRDLPGVGYSTSKKLKQMNVITCAELESISLYKLKKEFKGVIGQQLHDMCRGIDNSKLNLEHVRKSISAEANYGIRFENTQEAHEFLKKLSEEISDRLKTYELKGRCITLKLMFRSKDAPEEPRKFMGHGVCDAFNKSKNLVASTDDSIIITREVINLWNQINKKPEDARGIGIQMTKLESLKNKSTESTLLKFFDKKAPPVNIVEPQCLDKKDQKTKESCRDFDEKKVDSSKYYSQNFQSTTEKQYAEENCQISIEKSPDDPKCYLDNSQNIFKSKTETSSTKKSLGSQDTYQNNFSPDENLLDDIQFDWEASNEKNSNQANEELFNNLPIKESTKSSSSQPKQTTQPEYFKKIKPSSKVNKFKMPDIQEIDMKVLIELPDDIRNEIINEYKKNHENEIKRSNQETDFSKTNRNDINNGTNENHTNNRNDRNSPEFVGGLDVNLSFSQVDPEFLAALPDDMKNEVKSYFDAQKRERNIQAQEKTTNNTATRTWNMFKSEKVTNKKACDVARNKRTYNKSKTGRPKGSKTGSKNEIKAKVAQVNKIHQEAENFNENQGLELENNNKSYLSPDAANCTVYFEPSDENPEHSEMLTSLVNCLLQLPISQVKNQIRQWISNNSDINDVDFLSLTTYLGTLPRKRRLEDLFILTKCLHRIVTRTESCMWHETYSKIVSHIQGKMQEIYQYDLYVPAIACEKCKSN